MSKDILFHPVLLWLFWTLELLVAFLCVAGHDLSCQGKINRPNEYNLIRMVLSTENINSLRHFSETNEDYGTTGIVLCHVMRKVHIQGH